MEKKIKIYFVCSGTSTNDIINSINNITKKNTKKSLFDYFSTIKNNKLEKDKFPQLESIGIKEMYMCRENEKNKNIIDLITKIPEKNIFTSLEYSCIESALILLNTNDCIINPLPYMSENLNLKRKEDFNHFKNQFGILLNENKTNASHYWDKKNIISDFLDLKKESSKFPMLKIDWNEINIKDISSLYRYDFYKFTNILEKICKKNYKLKREIDNTVDHYLFICNAKLIENILEKFKGSYKIKYNEPLIFLTAV